MSAVADKQRLIHNVVRLRRAEGTSPAIEDIAAVRTDLERRIGPTVTRAMAARLLGVSQTALDRWIGRGDIPAVINPRGRRDVPLNALLDLIEAVEERKRTSDDPHPLASVLRARRRKAERLDMRTILPPRYRQHMSPDGHRRAELRSLAYHRAVAQRLDERMVQEARRRLGRWETDGRMDERYAQEWRKVLSWPLPRIARLISRDSQRSRDLRQSSPFAGTLSEAERRRILEAVD